uniref:Replication-associated protein n=1 Tax=Ficedula parva Genomoviridae sp. TaxID=2814952 RepID=A0A8A4XBN3_9VIRU
MPFSFHARYVLLTYPQCDGLEFERIVDRVSELAGQCVIGRERHVDGGLHYHAFIDFGRKFRSRKVDVFDVGGFHPNVSKSRGREAEGWDYATKDGDIVHAGLDRPVNAVRTGNGPVHIKWTEITSAPDRDSFWKLVHELDPKTAATSFSQLQKYCDWKFAPIVATYESPGGFEFIGGEVDGRDAWLLQSGIGAETALKVSGDECLKAPEVDYAVFDDLRGGITFFPSFKEWLGCQMWVTVKCLYREPKLVKWGRPTIYLANRDPRLDMFDIFPGGEKKWRKGFSQEDVDWLEANCIFVEISSAIFRASTE